MPAGNHGECPSIPPPHRRSQDFVSGALFSQKVDDFLVVTQKILNKPKITAILQKDPKIASCSA